MASRIPGADVQALRQFVGQSPWAVEDVQRRLARKVVDRLNKPDVWIVDETACPIAGTHAVGVARQYGGTLGKVASCQVAVRVHWRSAAARGPLNWRLSLPKAWIDDPHRAAHAQLLPGTPYRSRTDLALELMDQVLTWKVPALPLVADSFYGMDFGGRQALRQRRLAYVVEVEPSPGVWTEDPNLLLPPPQKSGRPRQYPPLEALPRLRNLQTVAKELPASAWQHVTWRQGRRGPQRSRFGVIHVWAAHGWRAQQHPPRVAEWLLVEWPLDALEPVKYGLAYFASQPPEVRRLVRLANARWRIEIV